MAMTTRCPHCGTAFRVVADQLRVRGGLVRCGVCTQIFDGYANIVDTGGPVPELTEAAAASLATPVPSMDTAVIPAPVTAVVPVPPPASAPHNVPAAAHAGSFAASAPAVLRGRSDQRRREPGFRAWGSDGTHGDSALSDDDHDDGQYDGQYHGVEADTGLDAPADSAPVAASGRGPAAIRERAPADTEAGDGRYRFYVDPDDDPGDYVAIPGEVRTRYDAAVDTGMPPPAFMDDGALRRRAAWHGLWGWGCLLLVICLVVQAVYVYRTAIATEVPALRPALQAACTAIGCEVGYARRIERISITGSSLQPPAAEAGAPVDGRTRLLLTVTMRNRYDKPQPWPALVLELTDLSDTVVVRKIITPDIYLPPGTDGPFPAGGERTLVVPVQTTGVQVNGYQLDKFFP